MKRVEKLAIAAAVLAALNAWIMVNAWTLPQERTEVRKCEWQATTWGTEVCR
jgi:hypothetical protein